MRKLLCCVALAFMGVPAVAAGQAVEGFRMYCGAPDPAALADQALKKADTPEQAIADKAAATAALAEIDRMRQALDGEGALPAPYGGLVELRDRRFKTKDPYLAELYRRVAVDQFARLHLTAASSHAGWAKGLSPGATGYVFAIASTKDWCGTDESNTAWLEKQVDAKGWPRRSVVGDAGAGDTFLLAQHADRNKPFQKKALALMEPLLAAKEVRPQDYALLFDRVAVGENRPQRYGSQGRCTAPGVWTENAVEDAATLDQTRAGVGLEPMAAYRARFVAVCGGSPPKA